jgi:type II secretory pathway component PulK
MRPKPSKCRGFVMVTALLILALVAVAIVTLASATSSDGRRTIYNWQSAQLDQMLLAGAADASVRLKTGAPEDGQSWYVELPRDLASDGATLSTSVTSKTSDALQLSVRATLGDRSARQTLTYKREGGQSWKLVDAKLET